MNPLNPLNPLDYPKWDELLSRQPNASFFHTSAWARVLHDSYGYKPFYLASVADDRFDIVIPLMEVDSFFTGKRAVSLPFTDFCPVLCSDQSSFDHYLQNIIDYGKKAGWNYIEFRGAEKFLSAHPAYSHFYVHHLDLIRGHEEILRHLRSSTRRNIKKALKNNLEIEISDDIESVKGFYSLNCITRKRHGLPPQPFRFFEKVHEHIISKGSGVVLIARYKGEPVASAVYFHFGGQAIYKYGASCMKYQYLRANNLIMWEAIKYFSEKGLSTFHFGRTEPENKGLLQFKRGWGTEEEILKYYRYDFKKRSFTAAASTNEYSMFNALMKKLPIPVLRFIGAALYPHVA